MSETALQWIQVLKIALLAGFAGLYGFGGVSGKWKRRFVAPALLMGGIIGFSLVQGTFSFWYLLYYPALVAILSIGYGEGSVVRNFLRSKLLTRAVIGLLMGVAALPLAIVSGNWLLWFLHIGLTTICSALFGAFNPFDSARAEETALALIYGFIPIFII